MMKFRAVATMLLAASVASPCVSSQPPSNDYTQVLHYTLELVNTPKILYGIIDRGTFNDATKQAMRHVVANINLDDLAERMTAGYEAQVTAQQISECMRFIRSPAGQKLTAAIHDNSFQRNPQAYINAMNPADGANLNAYMSGSCVFSNLPDTQEMHKEFSTFLADQTCSTLSKTNPDIFSNLKRSGYCKP
jgi:hypothetical protein